MILNNSFYFKKKTKLISNWPFAHAMFINVLFFWHSCFASRPESKMCIQLFKLKKLHDKCKQTGILWFNSSKSTFYVALYHSIEFTRYLILDYIKYITLFSFSFIIQY